MEKRSCITSGTATASYARFGCYLAKRRSHWCSNAEGRIHVRLVAARASRSLELRGRNGGFACRGDSLSGRASLEVGRASRAQASWQMGLLFRLCRPYYLHSLASRDICIEVNCARRARGNQERRIVGSPTTEKRGRKRLRRAARIRRSEANSAAT